MSWRTELHAACRSQESPRASCYKAVLPKPSSERHNTDESLRHERETADRAVGEKLAAIDEAADAVIVRARERADEVLAAARAKTDRHSVVPSSAGDSAALAKERDLADEVVREERADADEALRAERAGQFAHVSTERVETDKDLLSERARADDALAMRDEVLGIVSHDLRNMLQGIVGFAVLIQDDLREGRAESVALHAQRIERSGARMGRLVGDLVDVASIRTGKLAVTRVLGDPRPILAEALETFEAQASAREISLTSHVATSLPQAPFDAARILQVVVNLLSNAIKFTPSGGQVVARLEQQGDEIVFAFRDSGVGIPENQLVAIFERFHQVTKNDRRGAGLGLYVSRCIIEGHGGRIWAESVIREGSTFSFTLPIGTA